MVPPKIQMLKSQPLLHQNASPCGAPQGLQRGDEIKMRLLGSSPDPTLLRPD